MSDKLESAVVDSVSNANFKNLGDAGAFYASLSMRDSVESQRRLSSLADNATGQLLKQYNEMDAAEALALVKANTGYDLASQSHDLSRVINQLSSALSNVQILTKLAQTVRPETGG